MRKLIFTIILITSTILVYPGTLQKGTTGADQLLIPVGASSIATGGAFLSNVKGLESIYYNPAVSKSKLWKRSNVQLYVLSGRYKCFILCSRNKSG